METSFYGFAVLLFAAVILAVEGAYTWWSDNHGGAAQRIERRLRLMSGGKEGGRESISILKQRAYSSNALADRCLQLPRVHVLDRFLLQSGMGWTVARFLQYSLALPLVAFFLMPMLHLHLPAPVSWVIVLAMPVVPSYMLTRARVKRLEKFEEQLPEAADFVARAMRAGHAFANAMQMVGEEFPDPVGAEFRAAHEEINYGVSMNDALQNMANRIPLTDLRYLVIAVLIQRESGGNLAELLGNISRIIRQRLKLLAQVRVLAAEGKMSAWILSLLPLVVAFAMMVANPKYIAMLWTDPTGLRMLWASGAMLLVALLWMRKIIRIRV